MSRLTEISQGDPEWGGEPPEFTYDEGDAQQKDADRDGLYSLREMHMESLARFVTEVNDAERLNALNVDELFVRQKRMQAHFADMEKAHRCYRQITLLSSDEIYENAEIEFMAAMAKIRGRMREIGSIETDRHGQDGLESGIFGPANANSTLAPQTQPVIRVETARPPQLGEFDGRPSDWPAFRDNFIAEVHNKDFEPVTKLRYLQEACKGKAANRLRGWQPTNDNYQHAWKEMMALYNDEYLVVHDVLGKFFAVKRQEGDDHTSLTTLVDAMAVTQRQIETICTDGSAVADQFWIHVVRQRLPKNVLDSWEQFRTKTVKGALPTSAVFQDFLLTKARGRLEREYEEESAATPTPGKAMTEKVSHRSRPYEKDREKTKSYNERERSYRRPTNGSGGSGHLSECVVQACKESHPAWKCAKFPELPLAERRELVRRNRMCNICLNTSHLSFTCTRPELVCRKCPESMFKHGPKMCPKQSNEARPAASGGKHEAESKL